MIRVTGAHEIAVVASVVRSLGSDRTIVNEMAKEIRGAIAPIRTAIRDSATSELPTRGGLNTWVAKAKVTGTVRRSPSSAGVTIRMGRNSGTGKRSDLKRLDSEGRIRHPSWGHAPWSPQIVKAGVITNAITDEGLDQLEQAVIAAAGKAAEKITNG